MSFLENIFGGGAPQAGTRGGISPLMMALIGVLAYRTFQGKGRLAEMLGRSPAGGPDSTGAAPQTGSGLGGLLGGLLGGGAAGGILSGGLSDLVRQFQQNGQGDKAQSWIGNGPNEPVSPSELEQALGSDKIDWLAHETGMSRDQLLAGLSQHLPQFIDQLSPQGRVPTKQEAARITSL